MLHLLFISNDYSGAKTYTVELCKEMSYNHDIKVYILHLENSNVIEYTITEDNNITNIHIPPFNSESCYKSEKYIERCIDLLISSFNINGDFVIHANSIPQLKFGQRMKERMGGILVYTLHFLPEYYSLLPLQQHKTSSDDILYLDKADAIICVTKFAQHILHHFYHIPQDKLQVIYNGYSQNSPIRSEVNDKTKFKKNLGFLDQEKVILYVGRIEEAKGVDSLLNAFNIVSTTNKNIRLLLVGSGDFEAYYKKCNRNWGRITFTGKLESSELRQLYSICDIGVIPSVVEQCSYVALEMMAHNLPIIASDVPGLNEILTPENALLATRSNSGPPNKRHFEQQLSIVLKNALSGKEALGHIKRASFLKWRNHFTAKHMSDKTLLLYKRTLQKTSN